jgi:hypothetical protein
MSFDKKIREKLVNHIPKYDSGAWNSFQKMLPAPWYVKIFQGASGWVIGGLSTSALLFTLYSNNNKTVLLYEEIATLKDEIQNQKVLETEKPIYPENLVDTVYLTNNVEKYIRVEVPNAMAYQKGINKGQAIASSKISELETELKTLKNYFFTKTSLAEIEDIKQDYKGSVAIKESNTEKLKSTGVEGELLNSPVINQKSISELSPKSANNSAWPNIVESTIIKKPNASSIISEIPETIDVSTIDSSTDILENTTDKKEALDENKIAADTKVDLEEIIAPERLDPEIPKKKLNLPKVRFGITSDYLGLKVFANGPSAEVFLFDKLSINASALFSGQIETKHRFANDFNKNTGKQFEKEFERFVKQKPEQIEDISIRTSFIKLPIYFNYYINTWSRFNFIVSAGTKLDLSVYQDIGYISGPLGQRLKNRFEARPKPKTFNNLFYGMGVQYKYNNFVGQLTPYFDFAFRQPDYFIPSKNFGINASLKFEFGN